MAAAGSFLGQHWSDAEIHRFSAKQTAPVINGRCFVMDYPIKSFERFVAKSCLLMNFARYDRPILSVANEGGAIVAALLATGYTPMEIVGIVGSGGLDVITLIEGNQILPDALHIKKKGADHKGLHLRDRINELIMTKLGGNTAELLTFESLRHAGKQSNLYITALDVTDAKIIPLGFETYPRMPVADAVLASCAIQPYIGAVSATAPDGTTHSFMACSAKQSFPFETASLLFKARKLSGNFPNLVVGYGYNGTDNEAGIKNASGTVFQKFMMSQRAMAVYPPAVARTVTLF